MEPALLSYKNLVYADEGEEITLQVDFNGNPYPKITWFFDGMRLDEEKNEGREVMEEGALHIPRVRGSHAGTYDFIVSNSSGSVEGCTKLVVYLKEYQNRPAAAVEQETMMMMMTEGQGDKRRRRRSTTTKISTSPIRTEVFGEHVANCHKNMDSGFSEEFEVMKLL